MIKNPSTKQIEMLSELLMTGEIETGGSKFKTLDVICKNKWVEEIIDSGHLRFVLTENGLLIIKKYSTTKMLQEAMMK